MLEKVQENGGGVNDSSTALAQMMTIAMKNAANGKTNNQAQVIAMQAMMETMFGGSVPTLRRIVGKNAFPSVRETVNVREASVLMTQHRKGLLVLDDEGEVTGIITPKDVLMRVLAQNKPPDLTGVFSVMTPNPECVSADLTILDALKEMHDQKFLHLPVKEPSDGRIIGLVDVMDLVSASATGDGGNGGKGWRDFFRDAMKAREDHNIDDDDLSDSFSRVESLKANPVPIRAKYLQNVDNSSDVFSLSLDNHGSHGGNNKTSIAGQSMTNKHQATTHLQGNGSAAMNSLQEEFDFKVVDKDGLIHKLKCVPDTLNRLKEAVASKLEITAGIDSFILKYIDDEKDEVVLNTDAALKDAVDSTRVTGSYAIKLTIADNPKAAVSNSSAAKSAGGPSVNGKKESGDGEGGGFMEKNMGLVIGGGALVVAGLAAIGFILTRNK